MATSLKDSVVHWRKKLERASDDDTIINIIRKLSKVPITIEILQETHIGKCIRQIAKRQDCVGEKALAVLKKWRENFAKDVENARKNVTKPSSNNFSKKESVIKKESSHKSLSKHDVKDKKSDHAKKSQSEHKNKQKDESSTSHISMQSSKYINGDLSNTAYTLDKSCNFEESSPSLYTYEKNKADAKYKDYDPHADSNEGYNPECPELYPRSKSLKEKKNDSFVDTYEPSSVKSKSDAREEVELKNKTKKLKTESTVSECKLEAKPTSGKKEKHNFHKDKSKDSISNTSHNSKKESGDKLSDKKPSKHKSSDSKKSKNRDSSETNSASSKSKAKLKINCTVEFTSSEVRFEDCLGFNDIVTVKKKKSTKPLSTSTSKKPFSNSNQTSASSSSSKQEIPHRGSSLTVSKLPKEKYSREKLQLDVPKPSSKLVEVDVVSTLPEILPNYRPLPQRSLESGSLKRKALTDEEAIRFTSSRREKTAVYSGRKSYFTEVPTLFECCTRVLIDNIDAIEYMGEVPYFILKPILERCTPTQLYNIENYNPYLLDDTHELWEIHCKRDYKLLLPEECETWRELYLRAHEEREKKLKNVTANISASMSKSNPVRQVKLAYVDSVAKPPRDVARRQAKHGTALPVSHPVKAGPPSKASPKPTAPAINSAASSSSTPTNNIMKIKPKVAPLMAKTLKSMKMCFRR